jgi:hypothetical protein
MTTRDTSFVADGNLSGLGSYPIGFYANAKGPRPLDKPFNVGALAVGRQAGVYGATDDVVLPPPAKSPPRGSFSSNAGVWGYSGSFCGVAGHSTDGSGVLGESVGGAGVAAVTQSGYGVIAASFTYYGVYGQSGTSFGVVGATAVSQGVFLFPSTAGVLGVAGAQGPQVTAGSNVGKDIMPPTAGVIGTADQHPGVVGTSNAAIGVYGFSTTNTGVVGETANANGYAGYFAGNLMVTGQIFAGIKDAIVPFPDGSNRVLHCMESPEHWFEDFGTGRLKRGHTVVRLDADFAKVIKARDYKVFLTPEGDCRGLSLRRKGTASFEVRELMGGKSNVAFSYRIVGRRKDIKDHRRFAKIDTRLPLPRARPGKSAKPAMPARLRAFTARIEKEVRAQMPKRGRRRSAR